MPPSTPTWPTGHRIATTPDLLAVLQSLAAGRLTEVRAADPVLRAHDPLVADVVAADASARMAELGCAQLRDLEARVMTEAPDEPLLRWWVVAVLGERAFFDADLGAIPLAVQTLAELPTDAYAPTPVLYVRGRLRRIVAAVYLADPSPANVVEHRAQRDAAIADFLRCDFAAEAAITRGLSAALGAIATWDDVLENLAIVLDVRATLDDLDDSIWVPLLDQLTVLAAVTAGDLDVAGEAVDALDHHRGRHRMFGAFAAYGRALVEVVRTEGSPEAVDTMVGALDWLKRAHPQLLAQTQLQAANVCADYGSGAARRFGADALAWPPVSPALALRARLLELRLDLLADRPRRATEAIELLGALEEMGLTRQAGATAVRIARDLDRAGAEADAAELRAWGLPRLPDPGRRTRAEQRWAGADVGPPATEDASPDKTAARGDRHHRRTGDQALVTVRVLAPTLELDVAGDPVTLRDLPAKLLLILLLAHPSPVHVERAVDVLWPEVDVDAGRRRLNTVVYRLRRALDVDPLVLRRSGDVLVLDPGEWDVDLVRYRADRRAGGERGLAALAAIRGNLCQVQFPYDDHFVDERRALAAEAAQAIRQIDRAGDRPATLDGVLALLDPDGSLVAS